jgi:hypothetical protein
VGWGEFVRPPLTRLTLLLLPVLLTGCSKAVPDSDLVGSYAVNYRGDTATLSLRTDHTYTHAVLVNGNKVEEQTSTWKTTQSKFGWTDIHLEKFVTAPTYRRNQGDKAEPLTWGPTIERTWLGKIELCFNSDVGYCYAKQR